MSPFDARPFDALRLTQRELPASKHIPITHLNSATVFESSTGKVGSVLHIRGVTFDTQKEAVLNRYKATWHRALTALDERFCVYVTLHRRKENQTLGGVFKSAFAKDLDAAYHAQFNESSLYVNDIYLTLVYKGITSGKAGTGLRLLQSITRKTIKDARDIARHAHMKALNDALVQLNGSLSEFNARVVGANDAELGYSELITFLGLPINGGDRHTQPHGAFLPVISKRLSDTQKNQRRYPQGNLAQYLPSKHLFFGEYIQFQGATREDTRFGALITVKKYGTDSACLMLDTLLHLDSEFIQTNTFAIEAEDVALLRIKRHMRQKENVNSPAVTELNALYGVQDLLASDQLTMGHHHNTLLLLSESIEALDANITKAIKCYSDAGFVAVRETLGQEPAFWAQIPTNLTYIARSSLITSENFVDFAPLHNYRTGYRDANHLGSAVTLLETPSKTPYFFNYHVKGTKENPSKGHALIIGGNNAGKTVLMTFLDAQMGRYGGNTVYFDRDRGAEIYIRAMGGDYAILSPEHPNETCFNPLRLKDTQDNRQFNREWLSQLCKHEGELALEAGLNAQLKRCIDYAYDTLAPEHRTLSNAVKVLPMNFERWPTLRRFLNAQGKHSDGEYAYLFDNETDQLAFSTTTGFDMTHFLDREPSGVKTALLMYLFHRVTRALNGARTSILLDEGWQYFIDPYWKSALERWLPTLRKKNGHIVIATQSPSSVIHSPVKSQLLDNVATLLFFANPQAKATEYTDGFGLTHSEYECIANHAPESRLFLVKQDHDSCLCRLNLGHLKHALSVLSGNARSVRLAESLRREFGNAPSDWLPEFYKRRGQKT